jgi:hypothetical protein
VSVSKLLRCGWLSLVCSCAQAVVGSSTAPDPRAVQPERPSVATHAGTVAPGYLEIETGVEYDKLPDNSRGVGVPTVLKIGVAPRVQLSLFTPASSATDVSLGIGDFAAGFKWRIIDGDGILQRFAILPAIKFSTGGERGTGTTDASLLLIDSRTIGSVSLDLNVGLTKRSGDGTTVPRSATLWTASSAFPVGGSFGWQLECFGLPGTGGPARNAPIVAILTGPTLGAWRSLAFDAGIIIPIAGPQARAVYGGLVANVGRVVP